MFRCNRQFMFGALLLASVSQSVLANQTKTGWLEEVSIGGIGLTIEAKIDTGADNSSINAENPTLYQKDGRQWVKFTVQNKNEHEIVIDKPVTKKTKIKTKNGGRQERVVIELDICLGVIKKRVMVNLVDRSHFKYQLLIGRSFLSPDFLVDSSKTFSLKPQCQ